MIQSPEPPSRRVSVMVAYQHLPHYRKDVFQQLEATPGLDVHFVADVEARGGIKTLDGAELHRFSAVRNRWCGSWLWQQGLVRLWLRELPDVTIALGDVRYVSTWVLAALSRMTGRRTYFWTHGWTRQEGGPKRALRMAFYRLADGLLVYGDYARRYGAGLGYSENRMVTVYNSSAVSDQQDEPEWAERLPARDAATYIGAVLRLSPGKQLGDIVRAAAALRHDGRADVEVLLVGNGPDEERLVGLAAELGVPLHLPGAAYGEDSLREVYDRLACTVVPDLAGLSAIQSLRMGVPVVTHDDPTHQAPESESVVPGVTGEVFPRGNVDDLVDAIDRCLQRLAVDPAGVAAACRAEVEERWNARAQVERIVPVITHGMPLER